ncbi:hypothetical protein BJV77DRAFT_211716 [Russula vinacea]|nr:hypothetical protein BJV77DRAFT_211716 [Russula vinacea]
MPFNRRKKSSRSKSTPATSLPPRHLLPSTPESQSHSSQQQQQAQPNHPWSVLRPTSRSNDVPPSTSGSPFHRYGHTLSITAAGELLFFGGVARRSPHNDLYVFSMRDRSVTFLKTGGEVLSPRFLPAGVLVSNVLLIFGGATNIDNRELPTGPYSDSLYLLSLVSREWTRVRVNGPRPVGRFSHTVTVVGSKLFVFGGRTDGGHLNDMWAFDLNSPVNSNPVWNSYEPAPGDKKPPPRAGHVLVTTGDRIILFGGADRPKWYNDTWSFDVSTGEWTELRCTGCVPSPRSGHTASLVDDIMYVYGGLDDDRPVLDDLIALKLSTQQWFTIQKMKPSPSGRSYHAMISNGTQLFVLGGASEMGTQADESELIHVLETKHIEIPKPDVDAVKPRETTRRILKKDDNRSERQLSAMLATQTGALFEAGRMPRKQRSMRD